MKNFKYLFLFAFGLIISCTRSIENQEKTSVKIQGDCEVCEEHIEDAGNMEGLASVDWNYKTGTAEIVYDKKKTTLEEILKRISDAGYSNEKYSADPIAFKKLEECCTYPENYDLASNSTSIAINTSTKNKNTKESEVEVEKKTVESKSGKLSQEQKYKASCLESPLKAYYELKAGLVVENFKEIHEAAEKLHGELEKIDITLISKDAVEDFQAKQKKMLIMVEKIIETKDVKVQRTQFATVSTSLRDLLRKYPVESTVYVQQCKEKSDRIWLSEEKEVNNPYEGHELLECGKNIEEINF